VCAVTALGENTPLALDAEAVRTLAGELADERNILRELLRRAPAALIVIWGRELRFRYVNERAQEFLPTDRELVGRAFEEVFPEAADAVADVRAAVLDRGETMEVRDVPISSSSPEAWEGNRYFTFTAVQVAGPEGTGLGVLNVGHETTSEVKARTLLERQLATEHRIASQLQTSLMPSSLPRVPGVDVASGFRPAGYGHEIGGDFYDVFPVNDTCWMVVIGDVCGKGAEAATVTALSRYTLRAAAIRDGPDPCSLLARLNEALLRQRHDSRFVSAVCGFMEPLPGGGVTMSICVAGHLPPLRVGPHGLVQRVGGGGGGVLGIWDQPDLKHERVELAPGERLVLYTDGVLDGDPEREVTEEEFADVLGREAALGTAADTVRAVERAVIAGGNTPGRDDIALLVLRPEAVTPAR